MPLRVLLLLGFGLLASLPAAAAAAATTTRLEGPTLDHHEALAGRAEVEIRMDRGRLHVHGDSRDGVRTRGRLGAGIAALELSRDGHWLRLEVQPRPAPPGTAQELDSELELWLPPGSDLVIEAPAVAVQIDGSNGKVEVRTLSGTVNLSGRSSELQVQTISGAIRTDGFECPLATLKSAAGALTLGGSFEELTARSAESPLEVTASISDEGHLESGQGRVRFAGELGPFARLKVVTQGGEARLELARELEALFTLASFSGELENGLGPAFSRPGLRRHLSWQQGKAPRRIEVETFDGKISLLAR